MRGKTYSLNKLLGMDIQPMKHRYCFFNESNLTIEIRNKDHFFYEVDLERCRDSAELLDWILQVNLKTWCTPSIIKELLDTIEEACEKIFFNNAQGVYCPSGEGQEAKWKHE